MSRHNTALVTSLIHAVVERRLYHGEPNDSWPSAFKANASGEYIATVQAAWLTEGDLRLAVSDPFGTTGLVWFTQIKLIKSGVI